MSFLSPIPLMYRIGGGVVLCGSIVGYHYLAVYRADGAGYKRATIEWTDKLDKANAEAGAEHAAMQSKIDARSTVDNAVFKKQFDEIQSQLLVLRKTPKPVVEKVFRADCIAPKAAVEAANAGR